MSTKTSIEWTERTWNPITGCTKVSQGCKNCYAETIANRFWGDRKFTDVRCHADRLDEPLHWRKPCRIFVNSMSDLFHEDVPFEFIDKVMVRSLWTPHIYQVLTKRPARMLEWSKEAERRIWRLNDKPVGMTWPLPNVWLGVSVENQKTADERIPILLQTPATVRWVSAEPLLGAVNLLPYLGTWSGIDWLVIGGESGPGARSFNIAWARKLIDQCKAAGVPVFMKQCGSNPQLTGHPAGLPNNTYTTGLKFKSRKGGDPSEWPEDLRIREMP